ncbi:MAG: protein kinase [Planctomycetes bacterium]|nr:protein kinase [Planctomycetota bacterium]
MCPQAPDSAAPSGAPEIKGYRIVAVLGEGAVGTVYKARRTDTGVAVALKVLHAVGPKRRKHIARLVQEGRMIARLNHPGIVKGLDVGESGGCYYIAMELVDGRSLRDHLEAGRVFTEAETLAVAISAVRALHHAARHGVVHRDIKPANLMLTADGKVKITDLGLAKDAVDLSLTRSDATVGTPQYIAPEQARDSQSVDVRSDIFSLGSTLYHMVCGQPPFAGGSLAEILTKVLYETEVPVERLNPAVSAPFSKLLRRTLAKDPGDRYQGYTELLADLERVRAGRDIPGPVRRDRAARPSWVGWAGGALALAAGVGLLVFQPWRAPDRGEGAPPIPAVGEPAVSEPSPAPRAPAPWEASLAEVRGDLLALVHEERYAETEARLDNERPRFIRMGAGARDAFERLEEEVVRRIGVNCRRGLTARLSALDAWVVRELADEPVEAGKFRRIQAEIKAVEERIRALPGLLEPDFAATFQGELDEIRERARARSEAIARRGLRVARQLAGEDRFASANREAERLLAFDVEIFYPPVRLEIESFRDELTKLRAQAETRLKDAYRMFQAGLESRLASWQYQQAEQELAEFERRLKPWEAEAPREASPVHRLLQQDRSDFEGILGVWALARRRLEVLVQAGEPARLAFGKETSSKVVEALEGEKYPEVTRIRFQVGGRSLEGRLSELTPECVVEELAAKAGHLEPRWLALFYFYAALRPDLGPQAARALLARSEDSFQASGGAGSRFQERIAELKRRLSATQRDLERWALELHEAALADFRKWDFGEARARWLRMQDQFSAVFKSRPEYRDWLGLAEKCVPLEVLKQRFPGAVREHLYREQDHPLAFRLTMPLRADVELPGLKYAWESWQLGPAGLVRLVEKTVSGSAPFPPAWGVRVPIALNYKYPAAVTVTVATDPEDVMSLFCISLGGNIAGLLSLDGIRDRDGSIPPNQVSLWTSSAPPGRSDVDVFAEFERQFQLVPGSPAPPGHPYRLQIGKTHRIGLAVRDRERLLVFSADGTERAQRKVSRLRTIEEIEIRAWNNPIVLKELVVEGVLSR